MTTDLPTTTKIAAWLIVFLSIGPFVTTVDLWFGFLPAYPAFVNFRAVGLLGHALWFCAGVLGAASLLVLRRSLVAFAVVCVVFAPVYVAGSRLAWFQFTPGSALAVAAAILAVLGARAGKREHG